MNSKTNNFKSQLIELEKQLLVKRIMKTIKSN